MYASLLTRAAFRWFQCLSFTLIAINILRLNPLVSTGCGCVDHSYSELTMSSTRTRRPADRKNQLAACAAQLFRARGYHAVSINDIAAAAGVTGPALYRHFADKQAVLAYVLLSGVRDMEAQTAEALSGLGRPSDEQIDQLLTVLATVSVERREVAALWRWEGKHLSATDQREIAKRSNATLASWSKVLLEVRPELSSSDAELLCWAALSVYGSVSVHHTTVAKRRFAQLLVELAKRVLNTTLPATATATATEATPGNGVGTPSRREQVLSAAANLFQQRGFHDVSMEDIGTAAGIAGPSVYRHFPSKTALIQAIARRAADRLMLATGDILRESEDEADALRRLVRSYIDVLTGSPELSVSFTIDSANLAEADRVELLRTQRDYVSHWVGLLCEVHPELNAREARITVHAALTIANDFARTRRLSARPGLAAELETLLTNVLDLR